MSHPKPTVAADGLPKFRAGRTKRLATILAMVGALAGAGAAQASPGTYDVLVCADASDGHGIGADGWSQQARPSWGSQTACSGTVSGDGGLRVFNTPAYISDLRTDTGASQSFTAPADTSLAAIDIYRYASAAKDHDQLGYARLTKDDGTVLEEFTKTGTRTAGSTSSPFSPSNRIIFEGLDAAAVTATVGCPAPCSTDPRTPPQVPQGSDAYYVFGGKVTLTDEVAPATEAPRVSEGDDRLIAFSATDRGGGLATASLEYDGNLADTVSLGANNGRCTQPYATRVPCPLGASGTFSLSGMPDGVHALRVRVKDVAGNETIGPETQVTVASGHATPGSGGPVPPPPTATATSGATVLPPGPNGDRSDADARLTLTIGGVHATQATTRYGQPLTIGGRLTTANGLPIVGAIVEVSSATMTDAIGPPASGDVVRTGYDGRFAYVAQPGASRTVRFGYRAAGADPKFATTAEMDVLVAAGVRLTRSKARLRNRQAVVFRGQLLGQPVPEGKIVQLQVKVGRKWRTFAVARARNAGAYRVRYRFMRTRRKTTYRFRALSPREASYPYWPGLSRVVKVTVRG